MEEVLSSVVEMKETGPTLFCVFSRVFQRVLPLPGGNWNTLVGEWCCHPDPFANRKLLPRTEDCLTGDTYFLLARDNSCNQTLTVEPNPTSARSAANHSQDSEKVSVREKLTMLFFSLVVYIHSLVVDFFWHLYAAEECHPVGI